MDGEREEGDSMLIVKGEEEKGGVEDVCLWKG